MLSIWKRSAGPPTSWTIWLGDPDDMAKRAESVDPAVITKADLVEQAARAPHVGWMFTLVQRGAGRKRVGASTGTRHVELRT